MLNINEIRIKKIEKGHFLGYASILLDECFIIDGIELYDGEKGRYILMPLNPKIKRNRKNSSYPITNDARNQILEAISEKFDEEISE